MKTPADDTSWLSDAEILDMPENNLPLTSAPDLLNRREVAKQKKEETTRFEQDYRLQVEHSRHARENADSYEHRLIEEQFLTAMEDIRYREDLLLVQVEREEKLARKRLEDIEDRAIKLHDGRRAYVGTHGDFLDEQGRTLVGVDKEEANRKHQEQPNASRWSERVEVQQQSETLRQMKQDILDERKQRRIQDKDGVSDDDMKARTTQRTAAIAQIEARFHETLAARGPATDETYGGSDYMADFGGDGKTASHATSIDGQEIRGTLTKEFTPAAEGRETEKTVDAPKPAVEGPSNNPSPTFR